MRRRALPAFVALLVLLVLAGILGRSLESGRTGRFPSSRSGDPEGLLAFRRLLETLELPAATFERPWDDLAAEGGEEPGLLVVATPLQRGVEPREVGALAAWLGSGGAALFVDDATTIERSATLDAWLAEIGLGAGAEATDLDLERLRPKRPRTGPALPTGMGPAAADRTDLRLQSRAAFDPDATGAPLAVTPDGETVAAEALVGRGRVVRVLGGFLANDRIAHGDHLELALALVEDLRDGGPVRFDEYHHGFGGLLASARGLDRRALAWAGVQVLVVTLVYGVARGIRLGPPRPSVRTSRRSSLEYVRSMAALYRGARVTRHVVRVSLDRLAREARSRWGTVSDANDLARTIATQGRLDEDEVARTIDAARSALGASRLDERRMTARARELARLETEVFGGDDPDA